MRILAVSVSAAAVFTLLAACAAAPVRTTSTAAPSVQVADGKLVGTNHNGVRAFMGIPFAAAPTGERRWRAPAPATAWIGARDATQGGPACPQPARPAGALSTHVPLAQSEDCLNLNVWAPADASAAHPLPVFVWIHGGANMLGDASAPYYDGAKLAQRGIVVVGINYRLGYLGYFAAPALGAEHGPGNFALLDQIAALRWVQKNIAAFGGDPKRVTIGGESAGGEAVLQLMTVNAARGLFAQAVVESGGGWRKTPTREGMTGKIRAGFAAVGLDADADADADSLRAIPVAKLIQAESVDRQLGFGPFLDGVSVTEDPSAVFRAGKQAAVPLLIGSNTWEASLMRALPANAKTQKLADSAAVKRLYQGEAQGAVAVQQHLFNDVVMAAPARWVAREQSKRAPTWLYRFGYVRTAHRDSMPGAPHGGELPYVFDTLEQSDVGKGGALSAQDIAMASAVADCWAAFVRSGKPECALGAWQRYAAASDNTMDIGTEHSAEVSHLRAGILDAVDRFFSPNATNHLP